MNFLKKNIFNVLFVAFLLVIVLVPDAKALLLKGLMQIGFYQPNVSTQEKMLSTNLEGIKFKNVKGELVDLGDLRGKVIFLNFWTTWCPPCRAEMPSLNKLYQTFKTDKSIVFIFADADGELAKASAFMRERKYELPVYRVESEIPEQIFKGTLPTTVIFDKEGRLSFHHEGMANYADQKIIDFLRKLKGN
ncbi:TlpA family protein disulfide reductase [Pedobacter rhizosphaerae]|nr:TlpA disulfide reductase family protein [Pedobacter rhizosphaerae]